MTHHFVDTSKNVKLNWERTSSGRDATIFEKPVDPIILKNMPDEIDTFIDVKFSELVLVRLIQRLSNLFNSFSS